MTDTFNSRPRFDTVEALQNFLVSELSSSGQDISFFLGAGISMPPPSGLPSALKVIEGIADALQVEITELGLDVDLKAALSAASVKMESVFEVFHQVSGEELFKLFPIFGNGSPNLYHYITARLLSSGLINRAITTNFDCHIEKAYEGSLQTFKTEQDHGARQRSALYKIHGSVDAPESIVAVLNQVSRGLGPNKRSLLMESLQKTCLVVGWSDDDIDLTPVFLEGGGGLLIWFFHAPTENDVLDLARQEPDRVHAKCSPTVADILAHHRGVAVWCDPVEFFAGVWQRLAPQHGELPQIDSHHPGESAASQIYHWFFSLPRPERLLIIVDLLRLVAHWADARSVLKELESAEMSARDRFRTFVRIAICGQHLQNYDEALKFYDMAVAVDGDADSIEDLLAQRPVDRPGLAWLYGNLGNLFADMERRQEAAVCYELDYKVSMRFKMAGASQSIAAYADQLFMFGEVDRARKVAHDAIRLARAEGFLGAVNTAGSVLAQTSLHAGEWDEANQHLDESLRIARLLGKPDVEARTLKSFVEACSATGRTAEAEPYLTKAFELAARYELVHIEAELWSLKGFILKDKACMSVDPGQLAGGRQLAESRQAFDKSLELTATGRCSPRVESVALNGRGLVHYLNGQPEAAVQDLSRSLDIRTRHLDHLGRAKVLSNLALALLSGGNPDAAKGCLEEAMSIYVRFQDNIGRCQVFHDLAGVHIQYLQKAYSQGEAGVIEHYAAAKSCLEKSLAIAERLNLRVKIMQAQRNMAGLKNFGASTGLDAPE